MSALQTPSQETPEVWRGTVPGHLAGQRLDQVIAALAPGLSRSQAQRIVREGACLVDGEPARASMRPEAGAEIELTLSEPASEVVPERIPIAIIYEDDTLILVNKPAGMAAHPARGTPRGTLLNALVHHLGASARPTLVHRLDRDTTGAVLAAKSATAHRDLCGQMDAGDLKRTYWALVWGRPGDEGTISTPIERDRGDKTRMCVSPAGKPAVTHFRTLARGKAEGNDIALLQVRLETGRTHQIRVHLEHIGSPLVGERVYRSRTRGLRALDLAFPGQALHSRELAFLHPVSGARITAEADAPESFAAFV